MDITCCDRCGKKVSGTRHQRINTNYVAPNGNMSLGGDYSIDTAARFDLCVECWEEFKKFMKVEKVRKNEKCDCYCEEKTPKLVNILLGMPKMIDVTVCKCNGTRERDECSCGGDRTKCDFYPEVRKKAKRNKNG